jgi:uncharacterized protein with ATP-grasp and redox domains
MQLPPIIHTSEPNSWAHHTFKERIPRIIDDVIASNDYPREIITALQALRTEIISGTIRALAEDVDDRAFWDEHSRQYLGKTWLEVPWFWAEAFFYRRVLEAVRYFQPGTFYHRDPYANIKRTELATAPQTLNAVIERLPADEPAAFDVLLHADLWGNRVDLSMYNIARAEPEQDNLLVDDTVRVWAHLQSHRGQRIDFICDNAGTELLFDLALADFLLCSNIARTIVMHLKPHPAFVSDAMIKDVLESLNVMSQLSMPVLNQLASRLAQAIAQNRLVLRDHPFWVTGFFFHDLPNDLRAMLAPTSLVIIKGDANYRRLIGDCHWEPTSSFDLAAAHFPASVVAVRTLKSEPIVGLRKGVAEHLHAQDAGWNINGRFGVIQFRK